MRGRQSIVGVAALTVFLLASAPASGAEKGGKGPQAKPVPSKRLIVSPRHAGIHKPGPFYAVVRARPSDRVRVRLNGVASNGGWSRIGHKRLRKLRISPDHGLRHGRNVLRVTVKRRGAKRARAQTVTFRVVGRAPLAAAGRDDRIASGSRIRLDGTASRLHPSARRSGGELRHRWRLLRAPKGSRLARRGKRAGSSANARPRVVHRGPRALLEGLNSPLPHFRPDAPGTYRLGLSVSGPQGTKSKDEVVLRVDPDPMVEIETMAKPKGQSSWGVRLGPQFYPDPGDSKKWLQVVVLRSGNLELVSNRAYDCPAATAHPFPVDLAPVQRCMQDLQADLGKLQQAKERFLVIAVSQRPSEAMARTPAWQAQPPVGVRQALVPLGAGLPAYHGNGAMLRGRLSIVGITGGIGRVVFHDNLDLDYLLDDGDVIGGLLRDNKDEYSTYASFEHLPYDTQAPGSDGATSVMKVDGTEYKQQIGNRGGFHVVLVEPEDLGARSYWFNTGNSASSAEQLAAVRNMRDVLSGFPSWSSSGGLALIASRGDARVAIPDGQSTAEVDNTVQELVNVLVERYGATRNRAYRALDPVLGDAGQAWGRGERSYTLVAEYGTQPGEGLEAEAPQQSLAGGLALNAAPFAGTITRGSRHGFELETSEEAETIGGAGLKLRDTAISAVGDWPEKGNPGRTAAVAWIAGQTGLDTRRAYLWSRGRNFDWSPLKKAIEALELPSAEVGFKAADLAWAKRELVEEIDWLITARAYVADLSEPFTAGALQQWAAFQKIANDINLKVKVPPEDKTAAKTAIILNAVREMASEIPGGVGESVGVFNALYDLAYEWSVIDNQGTEVGEPFGVTVGDLGSELAKRLKAAQDTLNNQMLHVIAADYRKLRTVGLCAGNVSSCPDGPVREWQVTPDDQRRIADSVEIGVKRLVYTALFPAKYTAWKPPLAPWRSVNWQEHQPAGLTLPALWYCPFHNLPASAQFSYPVRRVIGSAGGGSDTWQVVAYAERTGAGALVNPYAMNLPEASVTDPLVRSVAEGGLGFHAEDFYLDAYSSGGSGKTNPFQATGITSESEYAFPLKDSPTQWINKTEPVGVRTAGCGY